MAKSLFACLPFGWTANRRTTQPGVLVPSLLLWYPITEIIKTSKLTIITWSPKWRQTDRPINQPVIFWVSDQGWTETVDRWQIRAPSIVLDFRNASGCFARHFLLLLSLDDKMTLSCTARRRYTPPESYRTILIPSWSHPNQKMSNAVDVIRRMHLAKGIKRKCARIKVKRSIWGGQSYATGQTTTVTCFFCPSGTGSTELKSRGRFSRLGV